MKLTRHTGTLGQWEREKRLKDNLWDTSPHRKKKESPTSRRVSCYWYVLLREKRRGSRTGSGKGGELSEVPANRQKKKETTGGVRRGTKNGGVFGARKGRRVTHTHLERLERGEGCIREKSSSGCAKYQGGKKKKTGSEPLGEEKTYVATAAKGGGRINKKALNGSLFLTEKREIVLIKTLLSKSQELVGHQS